MCHMRGSRTELNNNKNIIIIFCLQETSRHEKRKNHSHKTNSKCLKNNTVKGQWKGVILGQFKWSKLSFFTTRNIQVFLFFFTSQIFRTFWTFRLSLIQMRHKERLGNLQNILIKIYSYISFIVNVNWLTLQLYKTM